MAGFDAVFVGLTILDVAGRPVEAIPAGGNVVFIDQIRANPAGTAAGAVMNAAKLGISTAAVACLGSDPSGELIIAMYRQLGIDCSMITRTEAVATSATILPIRPNGERPALHARGASDELFIDERDFPSICCGRFLHYGGSGFLRAMDESGQGAQLLAYAKSQGLTTSIDLLAPGAEVRELLVEMLPHVDFFMPSMEEAAFLSGEVDPDRIADKFLAMGAGTCVFKWGARGSFIKGAAGRFTVPAYKVEVVDTTGCGDSYCGGFIAGLALGLEVPAACELGTATSALVATGLGSDAGVVDLATTRAFMETTARLL